jgi:hypothetical protein
MALHVDCSLQPRFDQGLSLHCTLSRAKFVQSRPSRALLSLFKPSAHLNFGLLWFRLPSGTALDRAICGNVFGTSYHVLKLAQSIVFHDADDIWAVELPIEFEILPVPVHTIYYFWAIYRAENLLGNWFSSFFVSTYFSLPYSRTGWIKVL